MSAAETLPARPSPRPSVRADARSEMATPSPPLGPGSVLVELRLSSAIPKRALFEGLRAMGFQAVVLDDVVIDDEDADDEESEKEGSAGGMTARFVGKLGRAIVPTNTQAITWIEKSPIGIDIFRSIESLAKVFVVPFVLEPGLEYEVRFVSRNTLFPDDEAVIDALDVMGFNVRDLIPLRSSLLASLDEEERDAYGVWFARARWEGRMSVVTPEDDFYFADLKKLSRHVSEIRHVEKRP